MTTEQKTGYTQKDYVVAITGAIGAGKSTVSRLLNEFINGNCKDPSTPISSIVDADAIAYQLTQPNEIGYKRIVEIFGISVLRKQDKSTVSDLHIDRGYLGKIVFNNSSMRKELEDAIWPIIKERAEKEFLQKRETGQKIVIYEASVFFEAGLNPKDFLSTICVIAPKKICIDRASKRSKLPISEIKKRWCAQMPLKEKAKMSDFVLYNSGSLCNIKQQVYSLYLFIQQKLRTKAH